MQPYTRRWKARYAAHIVLKLGEAVAVDFVAFNTVEVPAQAEAHRESLPPKQPHSHSTTATHTHTNTHKQPHTAAPHRANERVLPPTHAVASVTMEARSSPSAGVGAPTFTMDRRNMQMRSAVALWWRLREFSRPKPGVRHNHYTYTTR